MNARGAGAGVAGPRTSGHQDPEDRICWTFAFASFNSCGMFAFGCVRTAPIGPSITA